MLAEVRQIGEHIDEQLPLGPGLLGGNVADVIEHEPSPKVMGEFERGLRGGDPPLEPIGIGVAAAGAKGNRRDHDALVAEPLANLSQAGLRDLRGIEPVPRVEFHAVHAQVVGQAERLAEVLGEHRRRH